MPTWSQVFKDVRSLVSDDARHAWKWLSVQLGALIFIAPTLYENIDFLQDYIGRKPFAMLQAGLGILVMLNAVKKKS